MVSKFYRRYSLHLLCLAGLLFPYLTYKAETLPTNNNIETWLQTDTAVRTQYEDFKRHFGAEELILIGLDSRANDETLIESVCQRVEQLPGIRKCWSPARMQALMDELGVSDEEIADRLKGLAVSDDGRMIGLVALLSQDGLADRTTTVHAVREQLEYCQLYEDANLAGAPVVIAELDRLGNRSSNKVFFGITLMICLLLLWYALRDFKVTVLILALTVWAIHSTLTIINLAGGEMNFILDALPVMILIFTLATSVHFLHYFVASHKEKDPLSRAIQLAWRPCCLAMFTTAIGLVSLTISDIVPVKQFGRSATLGSVIALVTGICLTPAILTLFPLRKLRANYLGEFFTKRGTWLLKRSKAVVYTSAGIFSVACVGLVQLESKIDPLDFLPKGSKVLSDVRCIQRNLTNTESIEAIVDFRDRELAFVEKLRRVRKIEEWIRNHPAVWHTMSGADFLPNELPNDPLERARLLNRAQAHHEENDFLSDADQLWRISVRIHPDSTYTQQRTFDDLVAMTAGLPIKFTGMAPLLERAQQEIFRGFWNSFITAFGIITLVMMLALRSFKVGAMAMFPNLTPIFLVFGTLGWIGFPVDIGMMMSGSIALGIAVDGTFHFMIRYREQYEQTGDSFWSARHALLQTGPPIVTATVIASVGMLALTLSSFGPTMRFGFLMMTMLLTALLGDLVLLPALLCFRSTSRRALKQGPHYQTQHSRRSSQNQPDFGTVQLSEYSEFVQRIPVK